MFLSLFPLHHIRSLRTPNPSHLESCSLIVSPPELSKIFNPVKRFITEVSSTQCTGHKLAPKKHKIFVIKLKTNYSEIFIKSEGI